MVLFVGALVAAPTGWFVTDHLEQDNDFCISCHVTSDKPLHVENHSDFHGIERVSLAFAHAQAGNEAAQDGAFRCIDCHGGVGLVGRARVKVLSAKDAFWYVVGRFEEPDGMHWPLGNDDCTQCHDSFPKKTRESWESPGFHELDVHNHNLGVDCVACHGSHDRGGLPDTHFLNPKGVRAQCALCHAEYEEDTQ